MDIGHLTPRSTGQRHKDDFRLLFLDDLHRPLTTVTGQDIKTCSEVLGCPTRKPFMAAT